MPGPRISLRTRYRVDPENSAGRRRFTNLAPDLRSDSSQTRLTASRPADRSSSGQPLESHEQKPDPLTQRILAMSVIGYSALSARISR